MDKQISRIDVNNLQIIRNNVINFLKDCGRRFDEDGLLLDIAPQDYQGASPFFSKAETHTLDIDPRSGATFIADICKNNKTLISDNTYDYVVCTEVLEHTLQPFKAVNEIHRLLKKNGYLFMSVPFNFRIHGPLPDCWRFTEHGIRELLRKFDIINLDHVEDKNRWLMPIHYTIVARKQ